MVSNIFTLCSYACGGKTSILPALKWNLELKFPTKKVIVVPEPVSYGLKVLKELNADNNFKNRQATFLATALAQLDMIKDYIYNSDYIILMDRNIIDVLIFTFINNKDAFKQIIKYLDNIDNKYGIDFTCEVNYYYFNLPKNPEIINKCFERIERKETISQSDFFQKERKFKELYFKIVYPDYIREVNHPTDNTYILYQLLDDISKKINLLSD
jgi:hypothetical protein